MAGDDRYVTTREVAAMLHVSPKTVARWASQGKLSHTRTLGGHRRFSVSAIEQIARDLMVEVADRPDTA